MSASLYTRMQCAVGVRLQTLCTLSAAWDGGSASLEKVGVARVRAPMLERAIAARVCV